ncbi:unnamed protein product [Heterosigma akashiwo]
MLAEAFLRKIVCRWGVPRQTITNRIDYQTSGVFPELCRLLRIKLNHTTSYNSQANEAIESKVRAIKMLIRSVAREYPHRWKQLMSLRLLVYRCSFHRATGDTPFHICTGRDAVLPAKFSRAVRTFLEDEDVENPKAYKMNLAHRLQEAYKACKHNLHKQRDMLQHQDLLPEYFSVGDQVLLFTPKTRTSSQIFEDRWTGIYSVIQCISKAIVEIKHNDKDTDVRKVHVSRLKKKL